MLKIEVSKAIEEMWEKDQQASKSINSPIKSKYVPEPTKNIFNDTIKTPPREKTIQRNTFEDTSDG